MGRHLPTYEAHTMRDPVEPLHVVRTKGGRRPLCVCMSRAVSEKIADALNLRNKALRAEDPKKHPRRKV